MRLYYIYTDSNKAPTLPVEALLLPLRMPLFCSFEIIALVGCGIGLPLFIYTSQIVPLTTSVAVPGVMTQVPLVLCV